MYFSVCSCNAVSNRYLCVVFYFGIFFCSDFCPKYRVINRIKYLYYKILTLRCLNLFFFVTSDNIT